MSSSPNRGEVWLVDLGYVAKVRPCLVISIPVLDSDRTLVTLVPYTTRVRESRFEVDEDVRFLRSVSQFFNLNDETILHVEAATPRTFAHFTGRDRGVVGGIGQRVPTFGPFGFANRTPIRNLWLVGDSTHPGEGNGRCKLLSVNDCEAD